MACRPARDGWRQCDENAARAVVLTLRWCCRRPSATTRPHEHRAVARPAQGSNPLSVHRLPGGGTGPDSDAVTVLTRHQQGRRLTPPGPSVGRRYTLGSRDRSPRPPSRSPYETDGVAGPECRGPRRSRILQMNAAISSRSPESTVKYLSLRGLGKCRPAETVGLLLVEGSSKAELPNPRRRTGSATARRGPPRGRRSRRSARRRSVSPCGTGSSPKLKVPLPNWSPQNEAFIGEECPQAFTSSPRAES